MLGPKSSSSSSVSPAGSSSLSWCVFTAALYGFTSGGMAFFNKGLVSTLGFSYSNALLTIQQSACVVLFMLSAATGIGSWGQFTHPPARPHRWFGRWTLYVRLMPLALFSCGNALAGMLSLQGLSLPMFSVLKRFTPALVALAEFVLFGRRVSRLVVTSLLLVTVGFVVAGAGDLVFDLKAYSLALLSCTLQAGYLIVAERSGRELALQSHELLFYNSLLSLPFLLSLVTWSGELGEALFVYPFWSSPTFLVCLCAMVLMGMSLNYTQFLCTQVNSPLTTCMTGVIKGLATTIAGFFMFGGQPITALNLIGVFLNTFGSSLYGWAKYVEQQEKKQKAAATATALTSNKELPTTAHSNGFPHRSRDDGDDSEVIEMEALLPPPDAKAALP